MEQFPTETAPFSIPTCNVLALVLPLVTPLLKIIAILLDIRWYVDHGGLNAHFLVANGVEHLFTCSLAIHVSSMEKCLLETFLFTGFVLLLLPTSSHVINFSPPHSISPIIV